MEALMDRHIIAEITSHFQALCAKIPLHAIHNEHDYDKAVSAMNQLLDAGASDEGHPLADLANTLGALIGDYDQQHYPQQLIAPEGMLRFLMQQHQLTQSELPEVGTQGVISEILSGKRELNLRQIKSLSERFNVPISVFV